MQKLDDLPPVRARQDLQGRQAKSLARIDDELGQVAQRELVAEADGEVTKAREGRRDVQGGFERVGGEVVGEGEGGEVVHLGEDGVEGDAGRLRVGRERGVGVEAERKELVGDRGQKTGEGGEDCVWVNGEMEMEEGEGRRVDEVGEEEEGTVVGEVEGKVGEGRREGEGRVDTGDLDGGEMETLEGGELVE